MFAIVNSQTFMVGGLIVLILEMLVSITDKIGFKMKELKLDNRVIEKTYHQFYSPE